MIDPASAGYADTTHATRHDGGVRSHAATGRQNATGSVHAMHVFRRRFDTDQNDILALGGAVFDFFSREDDSARSRTRRGREATREEVSLGFRIDRAARAVRLADAVDAYGGGEPVSWRALSPSVPWPVLRLLQEAARTGVAAWTAATGDDHDRSSSGKKPSESLKKHSTAATLRNKYPPHASGVAFRRTTIRP